eukprot:snap_masked-scaffold_21-processed-gene-5.32-mRNA-1 protein AED:1.00 eAED:1.00 QI:0/0/0/0/1/1/2/0/197
MSLYDKFPPTEEIREFVLNEYFSYMEAHELPYSTVGVRMIEVADKSKLKHLNGGCPAFEFSCGFLFTIFICYMPDEKNFYGKKYELKQFMAQSIVVDDNGFFLHRRNNISKVYENCFYTAFGWKQKEQYSLETVESYYVQKDDIEANDISSQFRLPGRYYHGLKEGYRFILTPEVSQFFSIKPYNDYRSHLMAYGWL